MPVPSTPKNLNKSHDDQRQRDKGKQNVRSQHRKINGSDLACIAGRFFTDLCVVRDVADQKKDRRNDGYDHAYHVTAPGAAPDEVPTRGNENGAQEIKRGIEGGQVGG